jgi:hypothetical protein
LASLLAVEDADAPRPQEDRKILPLHRPRKAAMIRAGKKRKPPGQGASWHAGRENRESDGGAFSGGTVKIDTSGKHKTGEAAFSW